MILRLVAARLAFVLAVAATVSAVGAAVVGLDWAVTKCWPDLGPAGGLMFAVTAPTAAVLSAGLLAQVGRLTGLARLPDGVRPPLAPA